jgi:sulfate permease, SulP family
LWSSTLAEFAPGRLFPSLTVGLVTGIINAIVAISLAVLIFTGDLAGFVPNGIGLFLVSSSIAIILIGLFSSFPGTLSGIQDGPAAILAVVVANLVRTLPSSATLEERFITGIVAIALTSLLTGLLFILMGHFKLGALVRFLPYPVVGGFLAGTGWLLVMGGIGVMLDLSLDLTQSRLLLQPDLWIRWMPGLVLAVIMLVVLQRYDHFLLMPGMLVGASFLFYAVIWVSGTSVEQIRDQQWLVGPFPSGGLWQPLGLSDLASVHWGAILTQSSALASILLVNVVSLLLNASGIELVIRRDLDLNKELRAAGVGNVVSGLMGGLMNFHTLTDTALNYRASQGGRLTGWIMALLCLLTVFFGATVLSYLPKVVLGSLLVLLGLLFLFEWVYLAWFKFRRVEYFIILLILGVIATVGYLQGVQIGILATVALFVIEYSRVNVVKHALTGAEFQSRVTRSRSDQQALLEHGQELYILQLQGFIFFGTANNLLERVRGRVGRVELPRLRFVVLDFDQVSGLDSTAVLSFLKMKQVAQEHGIILLLTAPSTAIRQQLETGGFVGQTEEHVLIFSDLDHGLEWCEDQILTRLDSSSAEGLQSLQQQLQELLSSSANLAALFNYLELQEVEADTYLIHQGDAPDHIYFVASGRVTARLERPGKTPVRLETMRAGRVVGEIGFYLGRARTACVVAEEPSTVYRLTASSLERMEQHAPEAASALHRIIVHLLAERVSHLIVAINTLQRRA